MFRLLADPAFDALITGETAFAEIEGALEALEDGRLPSGCHAIAYPPGRVGRRPGSPLN